MLIEKCVIRLKTAVRYYKIDDLLDGMPYKHVNITIKSCSLDLQRESKND